MRNPVGAFRFVHIGTRKQKRGAPVSQMPRFRKGSYAVQNMTALGLDVFSLFYIRNIVQQNSHKNEKKCEM